MNEIYDQLEAVFSNYNVSAIKNEASRIIEPMTVASPVRRSTS